MITDDIQKDLRSRGVLQDSEILKKEGDLYFALNVLTQERRLIQNSHVIREILSSRDNRTGKKILRG